MGTTHSRNYGNLRLVRTTPEETLERENRAAYASVRGADGKVPSRACYEIAEGTQHPDRVKARRIRELKAARVPRQVAWLTVFGPLTRYFESVYGCATSELKAAS